MKCKACGQETPFKEIERNTTRSNWKCPKCKMWQILGKQCDCSTSELNDGLSDAADYDFEMESNPNGTTICGTLMRKHRMKRHNHYDTTCIYPGCNAKV